MISKGRRMCADFDHLFSINCAPVHLECKCKTRGLLFKMWRLRYPQCNVSNECHFPGNFLLNHRRLHTTFSPPPRLGGVTVQLYNYCSCLRSQINLNLKIPWQILAGFDLEGKLRCHSFCQSFLITEDDWLGHGSCPDNTAAAFRAAKANRYTVMYLASDSFQPQISKGKNDFFIRFQRPIESISMNRWVKS